MLCLLYVYIILCCACVLSLVMYLRMYSRVNLYVRILVIDYKCLCMDGIQAHSQYDGIKCLPYS